MTITDSTEARSALIHFLQENAPVTVITGAGISTDSGIPDYRDSKGEWKRTPPVQHQDYMRSEAVRKRYWARSLFGWPVLYHAQPNSAHYAIAELQKQGLVSSIITQNVDGLHQKAGATNVINLHGYANNMVCMGCRQISPRLDMHERCLTMNPEFAALEAAAAPDGDADLEADFERFKIADCLNCGGILKPDVVYFGDNVPRPRVEEAQKALQESNALLAIGTSLMVFSGYRFARQAYQNNQPVALLTLGRTRADDLATLKLSCAIKDVLVSAIRSN
ncbi:NAD-dependent protein deacetylase [Idiomarina sp. HP20-50]|uniref:NAD-dependent protein deacetylase n=1 Tax=Idiomarina sp. HP20-50 TaxID=3070813 RepID=UPI00294AC024|nr:NAD-dependent protein deacetylase [Idiomarina sp. HP20-50]MDV6314834.1 NAD-dependent protein deacetylase [Idiomarina sp. HP20-50]